MAYKKRGIPEPPTPREAVAMANFFDKIGEVETASLLDEYVVKCAAFDGDIKKQAGIFSAIWKRLKGRIKMFFYGEYKELYRRAKEAQGELGERLVEMGKVDKDLRKYVKNHELFDWRNKIAELQDFYTKDVPRILKDFDTGYAKIAAYLLGVKEQAEKKGIVPKTELEKMPQPSWLGEEGKEPKEVKQEEIQEEPEKPEVKAPTVGLTREKGWYTPDPRVSSVWRNDYTKEVRITKERFNRYLGKHIVEEDPKKDIVKIIPHEGKYPIGFEKIFGKGTSWQVTHQDSDWIYLMNLEELKKMKEKGPETPEIEPEVKSEIGPGIPSPSEIPEPELKLEPPPESAGLSKEKKLSPAEAYLKGKVWVIYKPGSKFAGQLALVKQPKSAFHQVITDKDRINRLNEWFVEHYTGGKMKPMKPEEIGEEIEKPKAPEIPERTARVLRLISLMKQAKE